MLADTWIVPLAFCPNGDHAHLGTATAATARAAEHYYKCITQGAENLQGGKPGAVLRQLLAAPLCMVIIVRAGHGVGIELLLAQ